MKFSTRDRLTKARVKMLLKHPFWGNLATRMKLNEADWCATAATDGKNFYYSDEFIKLLDDEELVFLFGHEVGHCVFDHMSRRGERDPQLWNMAGDYVVNDLLIENQVGKKITAVPILWDRKYKGMSADEIYDDLVKNAVTVKMTLDMHIDGSGEETDQGSASDGKSKNSEIKLSPEEMKRLRDEMKEAILQSAKSAGASNVPAGIRRMIQQFTAPKMQWENLLQIQLESSIKNNYSFIRPSRKSWHTGAVLPGMLPGEELDICIGIDVSGSIHDEWVRDFLSEIHAMMEMYTTYNIHIFTFDTKVYNPQTYTNDNGMDLVNYEVMGGGGTDFNCCYEYMKENDINPKQFIMFTDGEPYGSWGDENYCDTLFVIHSNPDKEAPFGITAHYALNAMTA